MIKLPSHQRVRTLVENRRLKDAVARLRRGTVEFTKVDVGGGLALDAWIMKPPGFDSTKRYPVLFYVYGEPASQTVLDQLGGYVYLWHLMLTQQGYVVASVDNRGTPSPRGRELRKAIYKKIGLVNSADQAARGADDARVAMGGLDSHRDVGLERRRVHHAQRDVPLPRPVSDRHVGRAGAGPAAVRHDLSRAVHGAAAGKRSKCTTTARRSSSPTVCAATCSLVHGSGDDNVHYQGTERLVNALVAANRPFTMMVYPNRTHCICEGEGTGLHLFSLLTRYLEQNLPAGGR